MIAGRFNTSFELVLTGRLEKRENRNPGSGMETIIGGETYIKTGTIFILIYFWVQFLLSIDEKISKKKRK